MRCTNKVDQKEETEDFYFFLELYSESQYVKMQRRTSVSLISKELDYLEFIYTYTDLIQLCN